MALTLQQRHNLMNGADPAATGATIYDKVKQSLRVQGQAILERTLLIAEIGHSATQSQADEWAIRALRGNFDNEMLPMIIDNNYVANNLPNPTDAQINNATKASLWPYITLIGTGRL